MHFVDEDTESPPIHSLSVPLIEDDLRRDVLRCSTDGKSSTLSEHLRESKVSQLQVAVISDQQILRLEISEDDVLAVQIFEAAGHGRCVEPGLVGGERFHVSEVGKELSSVDELQHEIEVFGILGESFEVDDEGVADLRVNEVLIVNMIDLLCLHDLMFVEQLQGHILPCLFVLGHLHLPKTT